MWKNFNDTDLIPKEFTICGSTYRINMVDSARELNGDIGNISYFEHKINLARNSYIYDDDIHIPDDELAKTYLHELGHCFLEYYNNSNVEDKEAFAQAFSNFMYEYFHTKE